MATYYVSPTGSNGNPGTQAEPFLTIQYASDTAITGDTILVETGTYNESVSLYKSPARTTLTISAAPGASPILDGQSTLQYGFNSGTSQVSGLTISGFDIRNYLTKGIRLEGYSRDSTPNNVITGNHIHHIIDTRADGVNSYSYGISLGNGTATVTGNVIHDIGWRGESMGVWMQYLHDSTVDSNVIYNVRKEGVRCYKGKNNSITNNRIFRCGHAGIAWNTSLEPYSANNYIYHCAHGFNPKHTTCQEALDYWGQTVGGVGMGRFWHNTIYRCPTAGILIDGVPHQTSVDIRDNIFEGRGGCAIAYSPGVFELPGGGGAGTNYVDYNVYSTDDPPHYVWFQPYNNFTDTYGKLTLAAVTATWGWEANGHQVDPALNDPVGGDLDYQGASVPGHTGIDVGDAWGAQVGARGLDAPTLTYTVRSSTPIAASSLGYGGVGYLLTSDEITQTASQTTTNSNEWFVYDFGSAQTFNAVLVTVRDHNLTTNIKEMAVDISTGGSTGPWTEVLHAGAQGTDYEMSGYPYSLTDTQTARYVRFRAISSFGGATMYHSDIQFGLLEVVPEGGGTTRLLPSATLYPSDVTYPAGDIDRGANVTATSGITARTQRTLLRTLTLTASSSVTTTGSLRQTAVRTATLTGVVTITGYGLRITGPPAVESHPSLNGVYDQTVTGGRLLPTRRGGDPTQPRRGGVHDEAATGGQVR